MVAVSTRERVTRFAAARLGVALLGMARLGMALLGVARLALVALVRLEGARARPAVAARLRRVAAAFRPAAVRAVLVPAAAFFAGRRRGLVVAAMRSSLEASWPGSARIVPRVSRLALVDVCPFGIVPSLWGVAPRVPDTRSAARSKSLGRWCHRGSR